MNLSFGQYNRLARLLDTTHQVVIDSIKTQNYVFAKTSILENNLGHSIPGMIRDEYANYGKGPSKQRMASKKSGFDDFMQSINLLLWDGKFSSEKKFANSILYRELPIAAIVARYLGAACPPILSDTDQLKCEIEWRKEQEDFLLFTLELDTNEEIGIRDLLYIYDQALKVGFQKVLLKIRSYQSIGLMNSLYHKHAPLREYNLAPSDSIKMLETFNDLDSERVELYASSFLAQAMQDMKQPFYVSIRKMHEGYDSNKLTDSLSLYNCYMIQAIIANDSIKVGELFKQGVQFYNFDYGRNKIGYAWYLGHHDLANYMSNLYDPDNPFGGTSYKDRGINLPPPPAYNLLQKIDVSMAPDKQDKEIGIPNTFFSKSQASWNQKVHFNEQKDTLTIPLTKKEWKNSKSVWNPEFTLLISNMSSKVLQFEADSPRSSEGVQVLKSFNYKGLSKYKEDPKYQAYLYIEVIDEFEEGQLHFETIELYLKGVDRPFVITLRFEKLPKQKKR